MTSELLDETVLGELDSTEWEKRAEFLDKLIDKMEAQMLDKGTTKVPITDYVRVLQMRRQFQGDVPKTITISWDEAKWKQSESTER